VERFNDLLALLLFLIGSVIILVQEAIQIRIVDEYLGTNKIQQSKQLFQAVLQRCPGDKETATRCEGPNDLRQYRVDILDPVRLVDDNIFERKLLEGGFLDETNFIGRYADFEILRNQPLGDDIGTFLFSSSEEYDVEFRGPVSKLASPILQGRLGNNNEMRTGNISVEFEV
jgi:hypothetical protein